MFFKVFNGYRPPIPEGTPRGLQDLMQACWSHNPAERPSFRFITRTLQKLIIEVGFPVRRRVALPVGCACLFGVLQAAQWFGEPHEYLCVFLHGL